MDEKIRLSLTKRQLELISESLRLAASLGHGDIKKIWRFVPVKLSYHDKELKHIIYNVEQNFKKAPKVEALFQSLHFHSDFLDDEKKEFIADLRKLDTSILGVLQKLSSE